MTKIFSIFGYGVPKDIMKDDNYRRYLSIAFNQIFDAAAGEKAVIIFSGGPTDCFPPYKRSEACEMSRLFKKFANRKDVKSKTLNWRYILENKSISSLENILFSVDYVNTTKSKNIKFYVFFEFTRKRRLTTLFKEILRIKKMNEVQLCMCPIDFDVSPNRYLDARFLRRKEAEALRWQLRALKDSKIFARVREMHVEKLKFFRENNYINNPKVVERWWRNNI